MFFYARATTKGSRNSVRLKRKISVSVFLFLDDDDDSPGLLLPLQNFIRPLYIARVSRYFVSISSFSAAQEKYTTDLYASCHLPSNLVDDCPRKSGKTFDLSLFAR